ncbi:MAG: hypothetical protein PUP91_21955 [Rhizonema sp. PD37]|nr:hypothetical protein [Rhizonema sp. PD37]
MRKNTFGWFSTPDGTASTSVYRRSFPLLRSTIVKETACDGTSFFLFIRGKQLLLMTYGKGKG